MTETRKKITLPYLFKKVSEGQPISWLTCYDYPTAYLQEQAGVEVGICFHVQGRGYTG